MSVVFLHSYWSLLFAVLFGHWWVHFRHERCGCRCCSVVTPLRKATQLCSLFQQIWSARFDECLLVSSKIRTSNTPKLQSPWLILKGSWFSKIQGNEWCLVPCPGVHQQFLADQGSVQTIDPEVKGHGKFEQRHGSFGRVFNTSKVYLWDTYDIYYVSIFTLTWRDSCIKRWQFSTSALYHPKFEWATLAKEREVWLRAYNDEK